MTPPPLRTGGSKDLPMARVKNASARAPRKAVPCAKNKTVRQAKAHMAATSELMVASAGEAADETPRLERIVGQEDDVAALARKYAARAVERLAEIMESENN